MDVSESESRLDEMERDNLQKAISEVEVALAASGPGTRSPLANFVENAKNRVAMLEKKIKESKTERENRAQEQATIVSLAQKEAALSAPEKETFSGFLRKEFFTKSDFGNLDKFYSNTWDRLSQTGKDEMSHRIWEGVRRDEYKFSELPNSVREKESKQVYNLIRDSAGKSGDLSRIPEKDREDFLRAFEAGKREDAVKILDRESFRENMFKHPESKANNHLDVQRGREVNGDAVEKRTATRGNPDNSSQSGPKADAAADMDLSALNLNGVKLAEAPAKPSAADIPHAGASTANSGPALRGG